MDITGEHLERCTMSKKRHPADVADREAISAATEFNVHLRLGPAQKINTPARSIEEAVAVADRLAAEHPERRSMIYAITAEGRSVLVPKDMQGGALPAGAPWRAGQDPEAARERGEAPSALPQPRRLSGKRAAAEAAARAGILPEPPDFSAPTHARFRKKLAEVVALVEARDLDGLRAFTINPVSSSPRAVLRYRELALTAISHQRGMQGDFRDDVPEAK